MISYFLSLNISQCPDNWQGRGKREEKKENLSSKLKIER